MAFARKMARELREEARQLEAMGFRSIAEDRIIQSEIYERVADEVESATDKEEECR